MASIKKENNLQQVLRIYDKFSTIAFINDQAAIVTRI